MAPLLPASGRGLSANSACWVASCAPWACMGMLQRCPLTWRPPMPNAATALLPLVTQPVSVRTQGPWPGQHSVPLPRGSTESGQSQLSSGWESSCRCGGKPAVTPEARRKDSPHSQKAPGVTASPCTWHVLTEHQCARPCSRHDGHRIHQASRSCRFSGGDRITSKMQCIIEGVPLVLWGRKLMQCGGPHSEKEHKLTKPD